MIRGDWATKGTLEYLSKQLGFNIRKEGWFQDGVDFVLVTKLVDPGSIYRADVWNGEDPTKEIRRVLDLPWEMK